MFALTNLQVSASSIQCGDPILTTNTHEILSLSNLVRQRFVPFSESRFLFLDDLLRPPAHSIRYLHNMAYILLGEHPEEQTNLRIGEEV